MVRVGGGVTMWSHDMWKCRDSVVGRTVWHGEWKTIADVIPSRKGNAYTLIFTDDSEMELSTYDNVDIR